MLFKKQNIYFKKVEENVHIREEILGIETLTLKMTIWIFGQVCIKRTFEYFLWNKTEKDDTTQRIVEIF